MPKEYTGVMSENIPTGLTLQLTDEPDRLRVLAVRQKRAEVRLECFQVLEAVFEETLKVGRRKDARWLV